jgi:exodeoxyribonuclease V alpha subunit
MKPTKESSTQEVLAGLVERVTFHNDENGFCVLRAKARGHRDLVTVVGHAAIISAGEWITASVEWINDRAHGQQFKARFLKTSATSSIDGIERYLGSGMILGIGACLCEEDGQGVGEEVLDIIEVEPDRLREVTGIGAVRAKRITDAWAEQKTVREIMVFLHSNGVGTARAVRIPACARHPRHWFQDGRRDRDEAWPRKDRHPSALAASLAGEGCRGLK